MDNIKLDDSDDFEGLQLLNKKIKDKADDMTSINIKCFRELQSIIMNLHQNDTSYTKNEFLKEIDSYKMTVEDILIILPNLFTHALTYSTLKKVLDELIEYRNKMRYKIDMAYIQDKLRVSLDISNDSKILNEPPKEKPKLKRKVKTLKFLI
jgi:hypothetical protein